MHRFYCPHIDFSPQKIKFTDSGEIHHLQNVLRMKNGDKIALFNGDGVEVSGVINSVSSIEVVVRVESRRKMDDASRTRVILACAIPKKSKFEFIIEKCTELGVDEIIPMRTARTEVILRDDRLDRKKSRYQAVAVNAAKQSQRLTVPIVHSQKLFDEVIAIDGAGLKMIPCLLGKRKSIKDVVSTAMVGQSIIYLIGPEGDFTDREVDMALKAGFIPVSLGETVLKVDTAAISVAALIRMLHS